MHCDKHKNYKGLRRKKLRCAVCDKIFNEVSRKTNEGGKYPSLTTSEHKFGLIGFLAELSSVMVFGNKLSPFFWRKGSNEKHRSFYSSTYLMLQSWWKRNPEAFKSVENFLYFLYTKHQKIIVTENMSKPLVVIEQKKELQKPMIPLEVTNDKLNPWQILQETLEKNNDQKIR